jgi:hypothetical protein
VGKIAGVRARRLRAQAAKRFPRDKRVKLGLVWLELAMRPRDRTSTLAELTERARPYRRVALDADPILERWRKRAEKLGGLGAT